MSTEIIFAVTLWLIVTIATPSKVRVFISLMFSGLVGVLLFFSLLTPRELVVSVPSFGDSEGYDLPYHDFKELTDNPIIPDVFAVDTAEDLSNLGKDILIKKDLSAEQLKSIENLDGFKNFDRGLTGIIPRYVAPTVRGGKIVHGFYGVEFAPLPLYKDLQQAKQDLNKAHKDLDISNRHLERKSKVLDAIRHIVNEDEGSQL
jgi:hypothetical protein